MSTLSIQNQAPSLMVQDQIKVEYAFETARVRLYLPTQGDTWFFVNSQISLKDFIEQCKEEDSNVKDIKFLDSTLKEIKNTEGMGLYQSLTTPSNQIFIQINNNIHQFESLPKDTGFSLKDFEWFTKCSQKGLSDTHSTTLSTFINQMQKTIQDEKENGKKNSFNVNEVIVNSLKFFDDVVVREELYRLYLKKMKIADEIQILEKVHKEYLLKARKRVLRFFQGSFLFFSVQFGISFHCIYNVEWLGWDLVEPLTYTLGQGLFVCGIFYAMRNLGQQPEYSQMDEFFQRRVLRRWYQKHGVDLERLEFLRAELKQINEKIKETEFQRYV